MIARNLLIVEDDPGLQSQMRWCFEGTEVFVADNYDDAIQTIKKNQVQVVTLDLGLPPDPGGTSEGFRLLEAVRNRFPNIKIVVITGREEQEHAVTAIANGAYDYYQKPIDGTTLKFAVDRAFTLANLEEQHRVLMSQHDEPNMPLEGLIATSSVMMDVCNQVKRVAPSDINVLITGETGTGKEIIATNIHRLSERNEGPLVTINCAAIPENLLESELFGHEKGSFTGAHARKIGKVEAAHGGTLFLDEIGDMPLQLQAKILRFLQERRFERVGSNSPQDADVRVVSATHRDLQGMIGSGDFREDLYYRLSELDIRLPALRERGSDVLLIAEKLLQNNQGDRKLRFNSQALAALESAEWPGNIRELENRVRRAAILAESEAVTAADLQLAEGTAEDDDDVVLRPLKEIRAEAERAAIALAISRTNGNISETSRILGVSRPTLYNLMNKYGIQAEA